MITLDAKIEIQPGEDLCKIYITFPRGPHGRGYTLYALRENTPSWRNLIKSICLETFGLPHESEDYV